MESLYDEAIKDTNLCLWQLEEHYERFWGRLKEQIIDDIEKSNEGGIVELFSEMANYVQNWLIDPTDIAN